MRNFFSGCELEYQKIIRRARENKTLFFSLCAVFILGLLIGLFLKKSAIVNIYYVEYTEIYYFRVFSQSSGMFSIFFSRLLNNLYYFTALYLFALTLFLMPLNFVLIFYRGFVLGCVCVIMFKSYSVNGIILSVLIVAPQNVITTFFLIMAIITGSVHRLSSCLRQFWLKILMLEFIKLFLFCAVGALYELILVAFILRPINFLF